MNIRPGSQTIPTGATFAPTDASLNTGAQSPVWHPFTQMKTTAPPLAVRKGEGAILELTDGRRIVDCISSWWVTLHGHSHPAIAQAIYEQAKQIEQVIFAGFTHEPAENLARKMLLHLPPNLTRVFFSDNGSTSVEVALKMAYQYWHNRGQASRTRFIGFQGGYHGDTIGAMSVGGSSVFWKAFQPLMFHMDAIDYPATFDGDQVIEAKEAESLKQFDQLLAKHDGSYAAIFIEPLVQGAAGMRMCRPQFLQALEKRARQAGILLIYDEVMTGFGRTGDWFACIKSQTKPDIICLSKGLSGGFLPLALTIATDEIYQAFYSDDVHKAFFHSHSFTGNPIACAAALASLKLLEENPAVFQGMEQKHRRFIDKWLSGQPQIANIRTCGTIAAMEVVTKDQSGYFNAVGPTMKARFLEAGYLIRPLGNTIYLMPPYCTSEELLDSIYSEIARVVQTI